VIHRYLYDGGSVALRESYRYGVFEPTDNGPRWVRHDFSRCDATRLASLVPGGAGSLVHADDDGTVDVRVSDRNGRPWFLYRSREGDYTVPVEPLAPTVKRRLVHPIGGFPYGGLKRTVDHAYRGTGMLNPLALPWGVFPQERPWYAWVVEEDILAGRRGVAGWHGSNADFGLWLGEYLPPTREGNWGWTTWLLIIGGVVVAIIAFPVGAAIAAAGWAMTAALVGGAMMGAGIGAAGYGLQLGVTGQQFSWREFGLNVGIGALSGAVGAGVGYGVGSLVGGAVRVQQGVWTVGNVARMSVTGLAAGASGGAAAGFVGGTARGLLLEHQGWGALKTGLHSAMWGAIIGGVVGGAAPWVARPFVLGYRGHVARRFMRIEMGWGKGKIAEGLRGIDVRYPVIVRTLPSGHRAIQYVGIGRNPGEWFGGEGFTASQLGVSEYGRELVPFEAMQQVTSLESTAAGIPDIWTVPGLAVPREGGGIQWLVRDPAAFARR